MNQPFDGQQAAQVQPNGPPRAALTDAELNAISYFAIGVGSEGSVAGRDVSNRLSFAGTIGADGRMDPVGNSGYSIGTLQTDLGQHPEVARTLVAAYQDWARTNHPDWVLDPAQQQQTISDLSRNGRTIEAQDGRAMDAGVKSHLDQFLLSDAGVRYVHDNDAAQAGKLMREVYTPLRETELYQNATPDDQAKLAAMVGKAYNQSEVWGGRILQRIQNATYDDLPDVRQAIKDLPDGRDEYMLSGRDAALQGAEVLNALRNSHAQSPLRQTWDNVLAGNPLVDPTRLDQDATRPNLPHEYATVKDLFLQKGEAPAFIQALDQGATSMHGRTNRQGAFNDDGLYAAGNNFVVWDRNGVGHAQVDGQWRDVQRDQLVRTQNADRTVDVSVNENGQRTPLLHVDPNAPRAQRAEAAVDPAPVPQRAEMPVTPGQAAPGQTVPGQPDRAAISPDAAVAIPAALQGNGTGPVLQPPAKREELEMSANERQLFERAMTLVQNKTGMTEDDAKKVATDVVLTARHTPGMSEKPEYMDVRNGHVMIAERVGKEPIFNGYVNIDQSRQQSQEQLQDKVAMQNQQREQQQAQDARSQRESESRNIFQTGEDALAWKASGHRTL
jgi:hypothetical protein